jgi:hypothetical protein
MATKKKAAKPAPKKKPAPKAKQAPKAESLLPAVAAIVNGPNSPKGAMDELQNFLSGKEQKELEPIRAFVQDGHTDGETVNNIRQFLTGKV